LACEDVGVAVETASEVEAVLGVSDHVGGVFVVNVGDGRVISGVKEAVKFDRNVQVARFVSRESIVKVVFRFE
jgi:hypothetical protein